MPLLTKPFPYQWEIVEGIERFEGRALVAASMGTGKSVMALLWAHKYLTDDSPIVIVCPASLKYNWKNECRKHLDWRAIVLEGMKPGKWVSRKRRIYILNYDILRAWVPFLLSLEPQLLITDEIHYCRGLSTIRTRQTKILARHIPYMLALSGTPLVNRPAELWPTLNMLLPKEFPKFAPYGQRYCGPRWTRWGILYNGATHLKELHQKLLSTCMLRKRKEDVLKDLPPKSRHVIPMDIDNRKEYQSAVTDFLKWLKSVNPGKVSKAERAEKIVQLHWLIQLAGRGKLKAVIEWVEDFFAESEEKLIVFGVHRNIVKSIFSHFEKQAVIVHGGITGKDRQGCFDKFNQDKRCRLLVGNIQAAGVGWSCNSASTVAFAEMGWTSGEHSQAEARVEGVGRGVKGSNTQIFYMVAQDTIESKLCETIQNKQKILDSTLDGKVFKDNLNVYDMLEKELTKQRTQQILNKTRKRR